MDRASITAWNVISNNLCHCFIFQFLSAFLLSTIHRLVRYEVINTGIMRRAAHPAQIIMINSLSVKYLPSSAGMLSGRIFAVTGFHSNKNVKSGIISSRAENRYSHPASLSHEFPLYTSHVGTPDIAKERHNAGNSNISAAPLHDSNSTPLHKSTTNIWHNNMTPQSSIIASNFQNRLSVSFIARYYSNGHCFSIIMPSRV